VRKVGVPYVSTVLDGAVRLRCAMRDLVGVLLAVSAVCLDPLGSRFESSYESLWTERGWAGRYL